MSSFRPHAMPYNHQKGLYDPKEVEKACKTKVKKVVHKLGKFKMVSSRVVDEELKLVEKSSKVIQGSFSMFTESVPEVKHSPVEVVPAPAEAKKEVLKKPTKKPRWNKQVE